ncbi:glutamyl-tRNA(Gln) amidotransferase subunit HER2 [Aspergillus clavatus NRRL 1]|uniref:Glutamyl-tRNA(Gln) amidotransferase subunit A, mitochondrial n=1 Tax=Aspergillus clavatus (strain ATCC 1007 / CBS 513.65 / DSM 816 / NCTC 3887 / NRRL 1 / QM 1276 / 107) TaxID=344612 RepID=A1CC53_ASPCL|nr:glutamyl-tRNA amidotransferase, A subunit, putative [Aspergillus clavatus NRRL 1]EAW12110.1 glutamyl-tRNA amidotransferase, A subunit, putative [Aspergillus clavatus NRRL 1]
MSLLRKAEKCIANSKSNAALNAFITTVQRTGSWREQVKDAELRRELGKPKSKMDGRFIAVKDNICTRDYPTTCASGILAKYTSPYNATVVELLLEAGAIVAGKTNLDEFGMGSHSVHSWFGPVKSPLADQEGQILSAGGSSGGSAVAVATDQCHAALGTDTGGSIRLPAAYTGTVGFKPSYGLVSRWGVVAYANSLDTVGILAKDTSSARDLFRILNQHDPRDPTNLSAFSRSRISAHLERPALASRMTSSPLRIGVPIEYNIHELDPSVRRAWSRSLRYLRDQGHTIHPVSLPATRLALSAYYVLAPAEASSNLAKYDGVRYGYRFDGPDSDGQPENYLYAKTRGDGFGSEVKRRILLGAFSLSADTIDNYFIQAQRVRRLIQRDFNTVFKAEQPLAPAHHTAAGNQASKEADVDVLICPTAPSCPPRMSEIMDKKSALASLDAYTNDVFTVPASLAGLPAVSVPVTVGAEDKDSGDMNQVGIQVIGQYGDDELVLKVGESLHDRRL